MRVILRRERTHPGAQLRFTDIDGRRLTCLATSTEGGQLADLELRHRRRARYEDRIRCAKDPRPRNLCACGSAAVTTTTTTGKDTYTKAPRSALASQPAGLVLIVPWLQPVSG